MPLVQGMTRMTPGRKTLSHFEDLPDDILGNISSRLDLHELLGLQTLSKVVHDRILYLGIPRYLTAHPQLHLTLNRPPATWLPQELVRHNHRIKHSLDHRKWHASQIGRTWTQPVIPALCLTSAHLVLGVGGKILIHDLVDSGANGKTAHRAREYHIAKRGTGSEADIVGVVDLGKDEFGVAQFDGVLQRFRLHDGHFSSTAHYTHPKGSNIHTLSSSSSPGDLMMTTTSAGLVSLFQTKSPWTPPQTFSLHDSARAWSSLVISNHPYLPPSLFCGVTGDISIHSITPSGPEPKPFQRLLGPDLPARSSPYDMCFAPSSSAHHPSLLLSSWYDSHVRLHDLRTSSPTPIIEFFDPWQWADGSAVYSTTFLAENHIAGGGARHGTVSLFDIRSPKRGWSVFSPNGKDSPVYALQGEGGRLWGVTERRAFILAFDGSGEVRHGLVTNEARPPKVKVRDRPTGYGRRGGRWAWTVRYHDDGDGCTGYDHSERGINLFDSLQAA